MSLDFAKETFEITAMLHPITYLNKILFASKQGGMQLWNIKTSGLIYTFKSFNSPITILKQVRFYLPISGGLFFLIYIYL